MTASLRIDVTFTAGVPDDLSPERLRALARYALGAEGAHGPLAVGLVITDDATIQALHATHMGLDEPTDVLTFALDDDDTAAFVSAETMPLLGEVVVSYETAAAQAADYGQTPAREVAFLCIHGVLHLLGYDDATADERAAMLARQEVILTEFEATMRRTSGEHPPLLVG